MCVFQPLKHWYAEAVNEAVQNEDETFNKLECLAAFNRFRTQAFKDTTIRWAWENTGLVPYNPAVVLDKVRETLPCPPYGAWNSHYFCRIDDIQSLSWKLDTAPNQISIRVQIRRYEEQGWWTHDWKKPQRLKKDENRSPVTGTLTGTYYPRSCVLWMYFVEKQKLDFGMHLSGII